MSIDRLDAGLCGRTVYGIGPPLPLESDGLAPGRRSIFRIRPVAALPLGR